MPKQTLFTQIKKRDGSVVSFETEKIILAIERAFVTIRGGIQETLLDDMVEKVIMILAMVVN